MSQTIELSDESSSLLKRQAAAHGLSVDEWIPALAREKARTDDVEPGQKAQAAAPASLKSGNALRPIPKAGLCAITSKLIEVRVNPTPDARASRDKFFPRRERMLCGFGMFIGMTVRKGKVA